MNGATGYLWSFVQNGMIVYQNLAWDGHLSPVSYTVSTSSKAHRLIHAGDLHVWVRALMKNGQWSATGAVIVRIQGKGSNPVTPKQTVAPTRPAPGTVLYKADTSGGLDKLQGGAGWKHLNGMLVNDGTGTSTIVLPYKVPVADYAVEADVQIIGMNGPVSLRGRMTERQGGYAGSLLHNIVGTAFLEYYDVCDYQGCAHHTLTQTTYTADSVFHIYRLEMRGNDIRLLVDGTPLVEAQDNRYLTGDQAGLFDGGSQINVRAIRIIAL